MTLIRAKIKVEHTGEELEVMFNPEEYSLNRDNNFASQAIPGLSSPLLQFAHGNLRTLEMELLFDTYEKLTDVRDKTQKLIKMMEIDPHLHAPPILNVSWASLQFRCVLTRAAQKFILFLPDGRPVRARVNVSFTEFVDPEHESKQIKRQTADYTKVHHVVDGETLSAIAARYYERPELWRAVALANELDDPRRLFAGQALTIPSLPYTVEETGEVLL
ncbi:CIS tube protein [Sorangium sp. So ce341]|uniref:CIS tube protein n=1 Tax=Sorangium sp. So ce341 TaxID=3133302 RepID=UPI003F62CD30